MKNITNILWGLVLVSVGIIFGLNATGITNINIFFEGWWTLFIIVPCAISLVKDKDRTGDIIGLFIGVILLLACNNIISFDLIGKLIIPVVLVLIGLSIIFKDLINNKITSEIKKNTNKNAKEIYATFSGQDLNYANETFEGAKYNAVFGGIKCDLRNAKITKDVVIEATAIFGGIDILVPEDVIVKTSQTSIFGGVGDARKNIKSEAKHTVYVNSTCIFGGVEIK